MENKNKGLIITIIVLVVCLLGTCGYIAYDKLIKKEEPKQEEKKIEETEEIKELDKEEKQNIIKDESDTYASFVNANEVLDKLDQINWSNDDLISLTEVNGKKIVSKKLFSSDSEDTLMGDMFLVTEGGELYKGRYFVPENEEAIITKVDIDYNVKRLGILLYGPTNYSCNYDWYLVLESDTGAYYLGYYEFINNGNNKYTSVFKTKAYSEVFDNSNLDIYSFPNCAAEPFKGLMINKSGFIHFDNDSKLIKYSNNPIQVSYIVFVGSKDISKSRYYIIDKDNKLYVLNKVDYDIIPIKNVKSVTNNDLTVTILLENDEVMSFDTLY